MERLTGFLIILLLVACSEQSAQDPVVSNMALAAQNTIQKLSVNNHALWDHGASKDLVWASVTLKNETGDFIAGRSRDDFILTETLLDADGNVVDEAQIQYRDPPYTFYQFYGPGFWERTVSPEKIDILFIVDGTGTMSDEIAAVRSEMHAFVNRLQTNHVDFRMAAIRDEQVPGGNDILPEDNNTPFPFHGVMHVEDIHGWIDARIVTGGENWEPTTGYDSLMLATLFDWRNEPDVRKLIVVITDTLPQSVYGTFWHLDSTAANRAAAELALKDKGFEVLFSQPATQTGVMDHPDMGLYTDPDFNPKAGCSLIAANDWDCGFNTIGTRISWPFQQADITLAVNQSVADSQYYFAWQSSVSTSYTAQDHSVQITISTADPDNPTADIENSFTYSPILETTQITLTVTNELDELVDDAAVDLYYEMGDRRVRMKSAYSPTDDPGKIAYTLVPIQDYLAHVDYGWGEYSYDIIFYEGTKHISVTSDGVYDFKLKTGAGNSELSKARGLLQDLGRWGVTEKPFSDFVDDAEAWLDQLEQNGIDRVDMERIKRFYVAMSGYVNASGYAEVEGVRITKDFEEVLLKFRDIIERIRGISKDSKIATAVSMVEAVGRLDLPAIGEIAAGEAVVEALKTYAEDELVPEVIAKIIEHIPGNIDDAHKSLLKIMINNLILGHWDDWPALLNTIGNLAMDEAMDEVRSLVLTQVSDELLTNIDTDPTVKDAIKTALTEFASQGFTDGFSSALQSIQGQLSALGSKERVSYLLDTTFDQIHEQLTAGPVRDFVLPITGLLMNAVVQQEEINDDVVIRLLAHYFTQQIIMKPHFNTPVADKLDHALTKAKVFSSGVELDWGWDQHVDMSADFADFRVAESPNMDDLNDDTWNKLAKQDAIDDFSQVLTIVSDTFMPILQTLFSGLCSTGYATCAIADDTKDFIAVLDAVGLMTKVLELGLKTEDLTHLNDDVAFINNVLLVN